MKLTNTLSRTKEQFKPINSGKVGMYNCGPTVYSQAHIGNLRKYVFDDILRRVLEFNNYQVHQIINITDVGHLTSDADSGEDKIEQAAKKEHKTAQEITDYFTDIFFNDLEKLNILAVTDKSDRKKFPRATEHIQEQIDLIKTLEQKNYTYKTSDGIYFDTSKFKTYGKLGSIDVQNLKEGARVEINTEKRQATDFALWKFSVPNMHRQQQWASPWGIGFPGWHIECSAMSMKYLGQTFDIHTGGIDHIPVHHNNEIAQSEAATGKQFVHYWIHQNFLTVESTKASKSLGNTYSLNDLEKKGISPLAYRYWLLTAHYQTPVNFTWHTAQAAQKTYDRLIEHVQNLFAAPLTASLTQSATAVDSYEHKFTTYINDDLDTPKAIALMWELLKDKTVPDELKLVTVINFDKVFGLALAQLSKNQSNSTKPIHITDAAKKLINLREVARTEKNYQESDRLRLELEKLGYSIRDTEDGPIVRPIAPIAQQ